MPEAWSYDRIACLYDEDMGRNLAFDDLAGYRRMLPAAPSRILELGCGTGRLTLPLARTGHKMCAVDRSVPMLKRLQEKQASAGQRIDIIATDARCPGLRGKFDAVLFAYCGFQYLLDEHSVGNFFISARRLLRPDGLLIVDAFVPKPQANTQAFSLDYSRDLSDGRRLERWKRVCTDGGRVNRVERRYVIDGDAGNAICTLSHQRLYTPDQLRATVEQHGFRIFDELLDYAEHNLSEKAARFFTVSAKPV